VLYLVVDAAVAGWASDGTCEAQVAGHCMDRGVRSALAAECGMCGLGM
jgi:hypothetical protein